MSDIVERLRGAAARPSGWAILGASAATEAADEIESLRARLAACELERDTARELLKEKKARLAETEALLRELRQRTQNLLHRQHGDNIIMNPDEYLRATLSFIDAFLAREQK